YNQYLFFFNTPTTSECYTLSLHDALPICKTMENLRKRQCVSIVQPITDPKKYKKLTSDPSFKSRKIFSENLVAIHRRKTEVNLRSEEHTSELQSRSDLVCRLLLEKKKKKK